MYKLHNRPIAILVIATLLLLLPHLDLTPVNIMEARNFISAREMAQDGNWVLTTLNGEPRYEKPPLPTWLTAFSGILSGFDSLYWMRLPVVLSTLLLVLSAYFFSKKLSLPGRQSFNNALILVTSFYIFFAGRDNQWDMYCHSFMMASILFLWNIFTKKGSLAVNAVAGGILLGFSILSKGPVSLYALLLPFLIAYAAVYKLKVKQTGSYITSVTVYIVIALAVGLSWPLYVHYADPASVAEASSREAERWGSYNTRPFYYYWSFFTQSGIWTIPALTALIYPYLKNRVSNRKAYTFTVIWTLASVILLSVIPEKKSRYLLPVLIPMALNTGFYIEYLFDRFGHAPKKEKWPVYFGFGLIGLIGVLFPVAQYFIIKEQRGELFAWLCFASVCLFAAGAFVLYSLYKNNFGRAFYGTVAFQVLIMASAFPLSASLLYNPAFESAEAVRKIADQENITVFEFREFTPEITWAFGKKTPSYTKKSLPGEKGPAIGLLAIASDSTAIQQEFRNFSIAKKFSIDMNTVSKSSRQHKERLTRDFYIISTRN